MTHLPFIRRLSVLLATALVASAGLAAGQVRIDAAAVPFTRSASSSSGPTSVGVDLAWDGDLVLVLSRTGTGSLPDANIVQGGTLPVDALGRIIASEALVRSDGPELVPGGLTLVHDGDDFGRLSELITSYADRLTELGFSVGDVNERGFDFRMGTNAYRAVFSSAQDGVLVYLGL